LRHLAILCQGLIKVDNGDALLDLGKAPFKNLKMKKPSAGMLKDEIRRRYDASDGNSRHPRPKNWNLDQVCKWLDENPIGEEADVLFLH
jgi:hypothetical protein